MPHANTRHPMGESRSNSGTPLNFAGFCFDPALEAGMSTRHGVLLAAIMAALWLGLGEGSAEQSGIAAVYSYRGGRTASGEHSDPRGLTAPHRSLPFRTQVLVTHRRNGRHVGGRLNDRGPLSRGSTCHLTPAAA